MRMGTKRADVTSLDRAQDLRAPGADADATRRTLIAQAAASAVALSWGPRARGAEPPHSVVNVRDFDELWRTLKERYCFFGEKRTDWRAVRALYRPQAEAAPSRQAMADVVTRLLRELYDPHTYLHDTADDTVRSPYFDLWVEPAPDGTARVTSVKAGSAAADAGLQPDDDVLGVDGRPLGEIAAALAPRCLSRPDPAAAAYALNLAVSGRRARPRTLSLRSGAMTRTTYIPLKAAATAPDVEGRELPGGYGLIVIRSFSDQAAVEAFDAALLRFKTAPGLVIDAPERRGRHGGGPSDHGPLHLPAAALRPHAQTGGRRPRRSLDGDGGPARALHLHGACGGADHALERQHGGGFSHGHARPRSSDHRRQPHDARRRRRLPASPRPHGPGAAVLCRTSLRCLGPPKMADGA